MLRFSLDQLESLAFFNALIIFMLAHLVSQASKSALMTAARKKDNEQKMADTSIFDT